MKIDFKTLRHTVEATLTEMCGPEAENTQQAMAGAQDVAQQALPFEQWAEQIVQMSGKASVNELPNYINYYDAWLSGATPESVVGLVSKGGAMKETSFGSFMEQQGLGVEGDPAGTSKYTNVPGGGGERLHKKLHSLSGRFDRLFEKGAPGDVFAEAVASQLWLDEESDFEAMTQAIKNGLTDWYQSRRTQ